MLEAANVGTKKLDEEKSKGMLQPFSTMYQSVLTLSTELGSAELSILLTPFDLKRLESYANNMLDYHVVLDLLPAIASLFFEKRLGDGVRLTAVQSSILLALGLQRKSIEEVEVSGMHFFFFLSTLLNDVIQDRTATPSGAGIGAFHQSRQEDQQPVDRYTKGRHRGVHPRSSCCTGVPSRPSGKSEKYLK